jgi:hypothetical protein
MITATIEGSPQTKPPTMVAAVSTASECSA